MRVGLNRRKKQIYAESPSVLDFLRSTDVGRTVPREENGKDDEFRTERASRLGRGIREMCAVLSGLLSALLSGSFLRLQSGG